MTASVAWLVGLYLFAGVLVLVLPKPSPKIRNVLAVATACFFLVVVPILGLIEQADGGNPFSLRFGFMIAAAALLPIYFSLFVWLCGKLYMLWGRRLVALGVTLVFGGLAITFAVNAHEKLRDALMIENTPYVWAEALLPGPIVMRGAIEPVAETVTGTYSKEPMVYFRTVVEREVDGADNQKEWRRVDGSASWAAARIVDASGSAPVVLQNSRIDAPMVHRHREGDLRYTEWGIRSGESLYILGHSDGARIAAFGPPFEIVTPGDDSAEGRRLAEKVSDASFSIIIAIFLAACTAFGVCYALGVFRVYLFFTLIGLAMPAVLFAQWYFLTMGEFAFRTRSLSWARSAVETTEPGSRRAALLKQSYNEGVTRLDAFRYLFPNNLVARLHETPRFELMPLNSGESEKRLPTPARIRLDSSKLALAVGGIGFIAFLTLTILGFRKLVIKRRIENLPTTPIGGVVVGLTEITGRADKAGEKTLLSHYFKRPCLCYRYRAQTYKDSDDGDWERKTLDSGQSTEPFIVKDRTGGIIVHPKGATVTGGHFKESTSVLPDHLELEKRTRRRVIKQEWIIAEGDKVYLLSAAAVRGPDDDFLSIEKGDSGEPFIISVEPEGVVLRHHAWFGMGMLGLALSAGTTATLAILTLRGFTPFDFLLAGLFPWVGIVWLLACFLVNDLVYLRNRMKRALSMIDVALQKRAGLVPELERFVKIHMAAESAFMKRFAELRAEVGDSPADRTTACRTLKQAAGAFRSRVEAYPPLQSGDLALDFQRRLTVIENQIEFARAGFNDAAERYNTRLESFPELLVARPLGMRRAELLSF